MGNPIIPATGNKVDYEVDFTTSGDLPLTLARSYNHYWAGAGLFGKHWISSFDYKLTFGTTALDACYPRPGGGACGIGGNSVIYAWRPDGRTIKFVKSGDGVFYEDKANPIAYITTDGTSFTHYTEAGGIEAYSSAGYVQWVRDRLNATWYFAYSGTYPTRVTHTSGRYVDFTWANGQLTAVRDPAGRYFGFAYTANAFGPGLHRLAATSKPGTPATTITYHYEIAGRPGALTGKSYNGNRYSTYGYDANGFATSTQHNGVWHYRFAYTPSADGGLTVLETNPSGKQTTRVFHKGKPVSVTGHPSTYCAATYAETTYDQYGYPRVVSDFRGNVTLLTHDAAGQLIEKVEGYGTPHARTTQYTWGPRARLASETVVGLRRTNYYYQGPTGPLYQIDVTNLSPHGVQGQTLSTRFEYEYYDRHVGNGVYELGMHRSVLVRYPNGDYLRLDFDPLGNLASEVSGSRGTAVYSSHNGNGQPGRITTPGGGITDYFYDDRGRLAISSKVINGIARDTEYGYDADGRLAQITYPDGVVEHYEYNGGDRDLLTGVRRESAGVLAGDATAEKMAYGYNTMRQLIHESTQGLETTTTYEFYCLQPLGAPRNRCAEPDFREVTTTQWVNARSASALYDELGRLRQRSGNNGQKQRYSYDLNGNVAAIYDSLDRATRFEYDSLDRVIKVIDPHNGETQFRYNSDGQVIWAQDARGLQTSYIYDGLGLLWATHSADTGTTTHQYYPSGQLSSTTRGDGTTVQYQYDAVGRLRWTGNGAWARYYSYDWCTNGTGRLCSMQVNDTQQVRNWTHFGYTPEGQIAVRRDSVYGSDDWTGYSYDATGRLAGISYPSGISAGYGYRLGKLVVVQATINGVTHDVIRNIKHQAFGPAVTWDYGNGLSRLMNYDLDGRLKDIHTDGLQGLYYGFDTTDQITSLVNGYNRHYDHNYTYDALGRLLTASTHGGTNQVTTNFDATGNRTIWSSYDASAGTAQTHYTYAGPGSRLTSTSGAHSRVFSFNGRGNVVGESGSRGTRAYMYDDYGSLIAASVNGATTTYSVDAMGQRVGKSTGVRYIYSAQNALLAESGPGGWTSYIRMGGQVIGLVRGGTLYYVHGDHLGRPEVVTNTAKTAVWRGALFAHFTLPVHDQIGGLNIGFPGQYYDIETDLWYNGFRTYDQTIGRYLQSDPIGLSGGMNTYAYVGGNPVNAIDPLGLIGYLCQKGNNIGIAIPINFRGATSGQIAKIVGSIERGWSGNIGGYNVRTTVLISSGGAHNSAGNTINVRRGTGTSGVDLPDMNTGDWYVPGQWGNELYAHEAGHLLGLADYGTGIMGTNLNGARPDAKNIRDILDPANEAIERGCGCAGQ